MQRFSERLQEHVLDLAWSLWSEMGVSGWTRRHAHCAIDPEPLILFTAWLGDADPRLRDESTDWCIRYGRYVSAARLRNLLRTGPQEQRTAFGEYAATVNAHSNLSWTDATQPRSYRPTKRSMIRNFEPPALIVLRLRALFGVGARAEIIRSLVAHPDAFTTAADLASEANYTKRNILAELESLRMAGLIEAAPLRNQLRYRLIRSRALLEFVGQRPPYFLHWTAIFRVLQSVLQLASRVEALEPMLRAIEAGREMRIIRPELQQAELPSPSLGTTGEEFWPTFEKWALRLAASLARGELQFPESVEGDTAHVRS